MSSQAPVQAPAPPLLQHIRVSSAAQLRELLSTFSFPHNGTWFRSSVGHLEVTLDFQLPEDGNLVRNMNRLFNVLLVQQPSPTSPLTRVSVHAQNLESGSNRSIEEFRNIINMLGRWPLGTLARDPNGGIWTSNNNVEVRQTSREAGSVPVSDSRASMSATYVGAGESDSTSNANSTAAQPPAPGLGVPSNSSASERNG